MNAEATSPPRQALAAAVEWFRKNGYEKVR